MSSASFARCFALGDRADVMAGLARPMATIDAHAALVRDLDRFYVFMLRALFGRRYAHRFALQPVAIGALDEPRYKGIVRRSALSRRVGDRFDHAHFVMFLPALELRGRTLCELFVELASRGDLQALWRKLNPAGEVHATDVYDLHGALDYAFKSAKLTEVPVEEFLLWPAAVPARSRLSD